MSIGLLLLGLLAWGVLVVAMLIKLLLWIPSDLSAQPAGSATPVSRRDPSPRASGSPCSPDVGSATTGRGGHLSIVPGPSRTGGGPGTSNGRCVNAGPSTDGPTGVSGAGGFGGSSRGVDVGAPPEPQLPPALSWSSNTAPDGGAPPARPGAGAPITRPGATR